MPQLLFKRQFVAAILKGEKTTTLRRWKSALVHPGSRATAPGVGWLKILSCQRVNLKDLTPADAKADGFASLQDLFETIRKIYPNHESDGRHWYRVGFKLQNPLENPIAKPKSAAVEKKTARKRLAKQIRTLLDKAVRQSGSLFSL
jgi:hypothetical protein